MEFQILLNFKRLNDLIWPPAQQVAFLPMKQFLFYLTIILSLLFIGSCSSDENEETQYSDLFQNVADNIIIPRYSNFDMSLSDLISELNNFAPTELSSLEILQEKKC